MVAAPLLCLHIEGHCCVPSGARHKSRLSSRRRASAVSVFAVLVCTSHSMIAPCDCMTRAQVAYHGVSMHALATLSYPHVKHVAAGP